MHYDHAWLVGALFTRPAFSKDDISHSLKRFLSGIVGLCMWGGGGGGGGGRPGGGGEGGRGEHVSSDSHKGMGIITWPI